MSIKILYVEDNISNAQFLQHSLKKLLPEPVEFHLAQDGVEGIQMAQALQPDLIIIDYHMPEMNGLVATKHLKQDATTAHIPIIMLTAAAVSEISYHARELGVASFLHKPVSLRILQHTLKNVLQLPAHS